MGGWRRRGNGESVVSGNGLCTWINVRYGFIGSGVGFVGACGGGHG